MKGGDIGWNQEFSNRRKSGTVKGQRSDSPVLLVQLQVQAMNPCRSKKQTLSKALSHTGNLSSTAVTQDLIGRLIRPFIYFNYSLSSNCIEL